MICANRKKQIGRIPLSYAFGKSPRKRLTFLLKSLLRSDGKSSIAFFTGKHYSTGTQLNHSLNGAEIWTLITPWKMFCRANTSQIFLIQKR